MIQRRVLRARPLEVILLAVLSGCAALFLFLSASYNPTAALFPRWVAVASLLFAAAAGFQAFGGSGANDTEPEGRAKDAVTGTVSQSGVIVSQGMYILLMYLLGFPIATLLFLLIAPLQIGYRRRNMVLVHAIVVTFLVTGAFLWLLNIQFPAGIIWDLR